MKKQAKTKSPQAQPRRTRLLTSLELALVSGGDGGETEEEAKKKEPGPTDTSG